MACKLPIAISMLLNKQKIEQMVGNSPNKKYRIGRSHMLSGKRCTVNHKFVKYCHFSNVYCIFYWVAFESFYFYFQHFSVFAAQTERIIEILKIDIFDIEFY